MEILNDILKQQEKQTSEIQRLTKEIEVLKSGANKPINLDAYTVANQISEKLNIGAEPILKASKELRTVISEIPKSVETKKTWGITMPTKLWILLLLVTGIATYYFAPSAVNSGQELYYKNQFENREQQIENFREGNEKTAKKYFGG